MRRQFTRFAGVAAVLAILAAPALAQLTITNPSFETSAHVSDEQITPDGTVNADFDNTPVIPQTVVVTDLDKTVTYVHGVKLEDETWTDDYHIGTGSKLIRSTNSTIPDGATVLVSYDYSVWDGWTPYTYVEGGAVPTDPMIGATGGESLFDVLYPDQGTFEGYVACGNHGWGAAKTGGCYQTVTTTKNGFLVMKARAFSVNYSFQADATVGNRVRAGIASGAVTDRALVDPASGGSGWKYVNWGSAWGDIVVPVPAAGTWTLFIEEYVPGWDGNATGIWSSLWDYVIWSDGVVFITNGPYATNITETEADIVWETDVPSNSIVRYDNHRVPYHQIKQVSDYMTQHVVHLTGLTPGTQYYYQVQSYATGLTTALSGEESFATMAPVQPVLTNFDFEAKDGTGNPTLVPWSVFGRFDGVYPSVANPDAFGVPALSPSHFAGAIASYGNGKDGSGILQRVSVTSGHVYVASTHFYSENVIEDPNNPGGLILGPGYDVQCRIGLDPTGGADPGSANVVWSDWDSSQADEPPYAQLGYQQISTMAEIPTGSSVGTIFLQVAHPWANAWLKTAFDDVALEEAAPCDSICCAKQKAVGWIANLTNSLQGVLVTKVEDFEEATGFVKYFWIQEDDRSCAMKVRLTDTAVVSGGDIMAGCRVIIHGRTERRLLREFFWGDADIAADSVTIVSSGEPSPAPVGMTNLSVCGGSTGVQRGAGSATGANNVALLVKTTGVVREYAAGGSPLWFLIDDGSNVAAPGTTTGTGIRVYLWDQFASPPEIGSLVAVTGVAYLDVYDPTLLEGRPNSSGDEVLVRSIRMRDWNDLQVIAPPGL